MVIGSDTVRWSPSMAQDAGVRPSASEAGASGAAGQTGRGVGAAESARSAGQVGRGPCRTCAERKYQDVSNDPSVSFQVPTSVAPGQAASAVSAHESEHVQNNAARAEREGMTATSTVVIHTDICPECGRPFVSGGTTTTTYSRKASASAAEGEKGVFLDAIA